MRIARAAAAALSLRTNSQLPCVVALALVTALSASAAAVAAPSCPTIGDESAKPDSGRRAVAGPAVPARSRRSAWARHFCAGSLSDRGPKHMDDTGARPETSYQRRPLLPFLRGDRGFGGGSSVKKN
jgi:hypothetical protein